MCEHVCVCVFSHIYCIESKCVCAIKMKRSGTPTTWIDGSGQIQKQSAKERSRWRVLPFLGGEIRCGNTLRRH